MRASSPHGAVNHHTQQKVSFLFSSSLELANAVSLPLSLVEVSYRVFGDDIISQVIEDMRSRCFQRNISRLALGRMVTSRVFVPRS